MKDPVAEALIKRFAQAEAERSPWENTLQDIRDLVRPDSAGFFTSQRDGSENTERVVDGLPIWANSQLASGLFTYLTNPLDRWFSLNTGPRAQPYTADELAWLEGTSDLLYAHYSHPESGFNTAGHEFFLDLSAYGTSVLYQQKHPDLETVLFRAFPLADVYLEENQLGRVDTVHRKISWTKRQSMQAFEKLPTEMGKDQSDTRRFEIIHMVFPRKNSGLEHKFKTTLPYASVWVCKDTKEIIEEGGYEELPYHIGRWSKLAGETYGRSPAWTCLPDIRTLNAIVKLTIRGMQYVVAPALMVPEDGFINPVDMSPSALNYREIGNSDKIEPIETGGQPQFGYEAMADIRAHIRQCFFVELIRRFPKKERQTATEIVDERNEMLQMMSPMSSRAQTEALGPMIQRTYGLLNRMGLIPDAPASLLESGLTVVYQSPAARAQMSTKAQAVQQYIQDLVQVAQVDPAVFDNLDTQSYAREMASFREVPRTIVRSPEKVEAIQQSRQEQQAQAQQADLGVQQAKALKDLSRAAAP